MPSTPASGQPLPLAVLIGAAFDATVAALHERLPALGYPDIRPVHCTNVFRLIDPDGTRPGVLADRARVTPQAMSEFVAYLESRGYLVRVPDPADNRARLVTLTPSGRAAADAALTAFAEIDRQWRDLVGAADHEAARRALERIVTGGSREARQGRPQP